MIIAEHNILLYEKDLLIKCLIEEYLKETEYAETKNTTFSDLIDSYFKKVDNNTVLKYFNQLVCIDIDDDIWLNATTELLSTKEYPTHSNVGIKYYFLKILDFLNKNSQILINDFIIKYSEENGIREEIINDMLYKANMNSIVGTIIGAGLRQELEIRKSEASTPTWEFYTYCKEIYQFVLPVLPGDELYNIVIKDNEGSYDLTGDRRNELNYIPPTVENDKIFMIEVQTLNSDFHIIKRQYIKVTVHAQKYKAPEFKTYKVEKLKSIKVRLPEVDENYKYSVDVPHGFGSASLETNPRFLTYTAPDVLQEQMVTVTLTLMWNDTLIVYSTPILFDIKLDGTDVDIDDK